MKYPKQLLTPKFIEGDILNYQFSGANLTLRLPIIPDNHQKLDRVFKGSDLSNQDTSQWEEADGIFFTNFAKQEWILEDNRTMDDIASCILSMTLSENSEAQRLDHSMLKQSSFEALILDELTQYHVELNSEHDPDWPRPSNKFKHTPIKRDYLDWFQYEYCAAEGRQTSPAAVIPIDNRFTLAVRLSLTSLHYPDRKNPFSDEVLRQVEFDLFDELMGYIDLQYTPETIAIIEKLKQR